MANKSGENRLANTNTVAIPRFRLREFLRGFDRTNALVALGVWLATFIVYLATKAPTLTFWDCGEFIAVSHILGIPHPPGTPLFVMIGRLFALLPFFNDPGARINFLSVVSSSIAVLFGYLCSVRILRSWFADQSPFSRFLIYAGSASGAFFIAFSFTQWGNAIEAEVYGMAMALFLTILWLALIYHERAETRFGDQILLLIVFLAFLSIGIHMTTFVIFPIAAIFLILKRETPAKYWFIATAVFFFELYLIFALSSRPNEVPYYVPVLVVFILYLMYVFSLEKTDSPVMLFAGGFLLAIAPIYGVIYRMIQQQGGAGAAHGETPAALLAVGIIGFVALILLSGWTLFRYFNRARKAGPTDQSGLISGLFVVAAGVMTALLLANIRGYPVFLALSVCLLAGLGIMLWRYIRFAIFLPVAAVSLIIIGVYPFLIGSAAAAIMLLVGGIVFRLPGWRTGLLIVVMAAMGISVHAYLPIRSSQNPELDQTKTSEGFKTTVAFIERKQYGSEAMTARMFHRRAEWENQFGMYPRMGFWRFFDAQYGLSGPRFFVLFVLGVLGMWEAVRRKSQVGLAVTLLILICSVGLVLYMNFADGTRTDPNTGGDYLEVRDRDYFWTPAFILFGLAIGIGTTALLQTIREGVKRFSTLPRRVILMSSSVLFLLPVFALAANYHEIDRSNNYIAYDYGANILRSADPGAVLFTYGDNDTFPLWALQEAYGLRTDVHVVNLSLATTKWYIKQIQDIMHVDLGWSHEDIDRLRPYRLQDGRTFGLEDQVIDAIIDRNTAKRPINFSTTVPEGSRTYHGSPAGPYLIYHGLVFQFTGVKDWPPLDVDGSMQFLLDSSRFKIRGLNDPAVFKDDNMIRSCSAYGTTFLVMADSLRKAKRYADAEKLVQAGMAELVPDNDMYNFLGTLYSEQGKMDQLRALMDRGVVRDKRWMNLMMARGLRDKGDTTGAEKLYLEMLNSDPTYRTPLEDLSRIYNNQLQFGKLRSLFTDWLKVNPADKDVSRLVTDLDSFMAKSKGSKEVAPK